MLQVLKVPGVILGAAGVYVIFWEGEWAGLCGIGLSLLFQLSQHTAVKQIENRTIWSIVAAAGVTIGVIGVFCLMAGLEETAPPEPPYTLP